MTMVDMEAPASLLVTTLDYDNYRGQIGVGRVHSGKFQKGMNIVRITPEGQRVNGRIEYLYTYMNLAKTEIEEAKAGEIVAFSGIDVISISDTIADPAVKEALPAIRVEAPTVRMTFGVNTSPFAGREGKTGWGTSRRLRERLYGETRTNVALRVEDGISSEKFVVSGRGELHLGILIETMRREGYEFEVSKPEVIFMEDPETGETLEPGRGELHLGILIETMRREGYEFEVSKPEVIFMEDPETGETLEPIEEAHVEVADGSTGIVFELMGSRRGKMVDMTAEHGTTFLKYLVPTRFLIGFHSQFMRATSGMGQLHTLHYGYEVLQGEAPERQFGSLVADQDGTATAYSIVGLQQRGTFFIPAGTEIYEGMVIGESIRNEDLSINVAKAKHLNNFRAKPSETTDGLVPPRDMSLDDFIEFMAEDELLEVTPQSFRLRKRILNNEMRLKAVKAQKKLVGEKQ